MRVRLMLGLVAVLAAGCASSKFAPVSGRVTLDNKPLAKAKVSFQPIPEKGSVEAGPASIGETNGNGEYRLKVVNGGQGGALVGKHRVRISLLVTKAGDSDARQRGGADLTDKVPKQYNSESKEVYDVPAGGTDAANFDLKSAPERKKVTR
jgi:hypothetical protein